jgi:hypothetical protein
MREPQTEYEWRIQQEELDRAEARRERPVRPEPARVPVKPVAPELDYAFAEIERIFAAASLWPEGRS